MRNSFLIRWKKKLINGGIETSINLSWWHWEIYWQHYHQNQPDNAVNGIFIITENDVTATTLWKAERCRRWFTLPRCNSAPDDGRRLRANIWPCWKQYFANGMAGKKRAALTWCRFMMWRGSFGQMREQKSVARQAHEDRKFQPHAINEVMRRTSDTKHEGGGCQTLTNLVVHDEPASPRRSAQAYWWHALVDRRNRSDDYILQCLKLLIISRRRNRRAIDRNGWWGEG